MDITNGKNKFKNELDKYQQLLCKELEDFSFTTTSNSQLSDNGFEKQYGKTRNS